MENANERDDILFEQLKKAKRRKRRRILITVVILLLVLLAGGAAAVFYLRARVNSKFSATTAEVKSFQALTGQISANASGSGSLSYTDFEEVGIPSAVTVDEILVSAGDTLTAGDVIARVDTNSVMSALADVQTQLEELDDQISEAKKDSVSSYINTSVSGRVKRVYAQAGDRVMDVMMEHGALAILSLDGLMTVTIEADLEENQSVTVQSGGVSYPGTVESSISGKTVVNLTDNGPEYQAEAAVLDESGRVLGTGTLDIRNPLAITGYAGTISWVTAQENSQVYSGGYLFSLTDTGYTVNYDTLLRSRSQTEQTMATLLQLLQDGCATAPIDGIVTEVSGLTSDTMVYSDDGTELILATMAPDKQLTVSVAVDETDILSLELGQSAQITVSSIGDQVYSGTVTEISKIGTSMSGVTQYTAVVTLDRDPQMLSGMTASVDIQKQQVEGVVLIPTDALHQIRNSAYVYTSYDEQTKEYGGMVEVVAGTSNSSYVEIVSGLNPGDTVYYTEKASTTSSSFMMPMGDMMGGSSGGFSGSGFGSSGGFGGSGGNRGGSGSGFPGSNRPGMGG